MKPFIIILLLPIHLFAQPFSKREIKDWELQSKNVNIIRDKWGIPHIYGKSDADAVFGVLYAQCEDDFDRVEYNYIEKLGRLSEIKGESQFYNDLLIRLVIDSSEAIRDYKLSPLWLKKLLNAYAAGINYYLYKNPARKPRLLKRFMPWFPLLWTDGSIGSINTAELTTANIKKFYQDSSKSLAYEHKDPAPTGSNGFAFSPSITASGNSILYINPHVTFYYRPEVHMVSEEGLNTYGAITWGQFFVYQGFNEKCGWMHTSSEADVADLYVEKTTKTKTGYEYLYNGKKRPFTSKKIFIHTLQSDGSLKHKSITVYHSHHGPVLSEKEGNLITLKANNRSMTSLIQSWQRTKAKSFTEYKKVMDLKANTSNNTVYADAEGNIAYWHGNFIPIRNPEIDWSKPVDGSIYATEWKGLHNMDETVHLFNPKNGWLQNCNSTPYTVAGTYSPRKENYPLYMAPDGENFRGVNAVKVLSSENKFTIDKVIAAGYDTYLAAFDVLLPRLFRADSTLLSVPNRKLISKPIYLLKNWDRRVSESSVATTVAISWATNLLPHMNATIKDQVIRFNSFVATASDSLLLAYLVTAIRDLENRFNHWEQPWGDVNRFQRISADIDHKFSDEEPSLPIAFASATWGMLPSYSASSIYGTKKRYGIHGNSFICAVEFGKRIKAKSLLAGGQSGSPYSNHFTDQALMYTKGIFKDVFFYKEDVIANSERQYHPGE